MSKILITPQDVGRKVRLRNDITGTVVGYNLGKELPVTIIHHHGDSTMWRYSPDGCFHISRVKSQWDVVAWADEHPAQPEPRPKDLRDEFAMVVMQGILSNPDCMLENKKWEQVYAEHAYTLADAMMKAREARHG